MKKLKLLLPLFLFSLFTYSQNVFRAVVKDSALGEALAGVTAFAQKNEGLQTNDSGVVVFRNLPDGPVTFIFSYSGATTKKFPSFYLTQLFTLFI